MKPAPPSGLRRSAPDEAVFAFLNDLVRPIAMYLYGRKIYETMAIWETPDVIPGRTPGMQDFARIWQAAAVRDLKAPLPHDVSVAGPNLAAQAIRAWLVDEYRLLIVPMMLGGGKRVLPSNVCVKLDLLDEHRFANGMVYLRYHTRA